MGIFCINCGIAYDAYSVMLLWNNQHLAQCKEGYGHTWSKVRADGLAAIYRNNNPDHGELETG